MADVAVKCKVSAAQHEGRVVVLSNQQGAVQTIAPVLEKITDVTVIDAKYDKYFDDTMYYTS